VRISLGAVALLGLFLRDQQLIGSAQEFRRAACDLIFKIFTMFKKFAVPMLNLIEHFIERIDEVSDFVIAVFFGPDGVVFSG
jgi:hypothetical protein